MNIDFVTGEARFAYVAEMLALPWALTPDGSPDVAVMVGSGEASGSVATVRLDESTAASLFRRLTRLEELATDRADAHGRFLATYSAEPVGEPTVDVVRRQLEQRIERIIGTPVPRKQPWGGAPYAVALSHDVDAVRLGRSAKRVAARLARATRRGPRATVAALGQSAAAFVSPERDPFWTFDYLREQERHFGFQSTWNFQTRPGRRIVDPDYSLSEKRIAALITALEEEGHDIGLHYHYDSAEDSERLIAELQELQAVTGRPVHTGRAHYLRFSYQRLVTALRGTALRIDTSIGYPDQVGFRTGTCWPHLLFDHDRDQPAPQWEFPMHVMDGTLRTYLQCGPEEGLRTALAIRDQVRNEGGVLGVVWHNSSLDEVNWRGWRAVYANLLQEFASDGALVAPESVLLERLVGQ